jgi:orotate phosphoribosyltransferase
LCDYDTILETALETNYISDADVKTLQIWRKDPANWKPRIQ